MNLFLDSFWRAVADCLRPRVIVLSMLPLILMVALSLTLGYFYWDSALDGVRGMLEGSSLLTTLFEWLQGIGAEGFKTVLAPLIVVFAVTPLIVLMSLLVVALLMTPALVTMVAERRFAQLERKRGGSLAGEPVLVAGLHAAGAGRLAGVDSAVADSPADPDPAAADLGLADLPGHGLRCPGRTRQQAGAARAAAPAPQLPARRSA